MKKILKWTGIALGGLLLLIVGLLVFVSVARPKVADADPSLKIQATPERLARGKYLADHVADCRSCHSERDWKRFGGPVVSGSDYGGGEVVFDERIGLPGRFIPRNITPHGLSRYNDGELVRVMRTGVTKEGEPLFPMMPYRNYREMSQEDLYSVVAFMRSLPSVTNEVPPHAPAGPFRFILRLIPEDAPPFPNAPDPKDSIAHGRYLAKIASCADCHTLSDKGEPLPGMFLAGGVEFPLLQLENPELPVVPGAKIRTANLTPDPDTGIGRWTRDQFVQRFRDWRGEAGVARSAPVKSGQFQTVMPWLEYAGMTDADLGAIYDYLRTVPPVKNAVVKFTPG